MRPQVAADQLDVYPELAEHNGLSQPLTALPALLSQPVHASCREKAEKIKTEVSQTEEALPQCTKHGLQC